MIDRRRRLGRRAPVPARALHRAHVPGGVQLRRASAVHRAPGRGGLGGWRRRAVSPQARMTARRHPPRARALRPRLGGRREPEPPRGRFGSASPARASSRSTIARTASIPTLACSRSRSSSFAIRRAERFSRLTALSSSRSSNPHGPELLLDAGAKLLLALRRLCDRLVWLGHGDGAQRLTCWGHTCASSPPRRHGRSARSWRPGRAPPRRAVRRCARERVRPGRASLGRVVSTPRPLDLSRRRQPRHLGRSR